MGAGGGGGESALLVYLRLKYGALLQSRYGRRVMEGLFILGERRLKTQEPILKMAVYKYTTGVGVKVRLGLGSKEQESC